MRSAERLLPLLVLLALGGCSTLSGTVQAVKDTVVTPVANAITPAIAPAEAASAPAAVAKKPEPVLAPVDPNAQRAADPALRALRAGRHDEAEKALRALTQAHPVLGGPHANLGILYRQAGKPNESVAALEKAVAASPEQALFHNQLGISYRAQGQFQKARGAYERAIELDAGYAAPVLNLGILNDLYLGEPARALELYERYQALAGGKDATVAKWATELKNRKPEKLLTKKEQP
jgi:tetratricopeptide (TPR) repeat protein